MSNCQELVNLKNLYKTLKYFDLTFNKKSKSYYNHMTHGEIYDDLFFFFQRKMK